MREVLVVATILMFSACLARAASETITSNNSSLKFTIDDTPGFRLPRTLEWTVDGRRILVYPSGPSTFLDIGHHHIDGHVATNQMHAQGTLLGFGPGATAGTVTGGIVYSVDGGTPGNGISRIAEKVDIRNTTSGALSLSLAGLGYKSPQASLEVPDLTGLNITGTTAIFFQGNTGAVSITDPPFAPVTVLPVVSFSGFNPLLNQSFSLPAGATLTMITELKVARSATLMALPLFWLLLATIVLATAVGMVIWRRRRQRN